MCSDQEAVNLVRDVKDPQQASKMLVDHALARFSTDNLSVMIVRFDAQKLEANAKVGIGVEDEKHKLTEGVSEAELIVTEFRRNSIVQPEAVADDEAEAIQESAVGEMDEDQEPGPEVTPGGDKEAEHLLAEKKR